MNNPIDISHPRVLTYIRGGGNISEKKLLLGYKFQQVSSHPYGKILESSKKINFFSPFPEKKIAEKSLNYWTPITEPDDHPPLKKSNSAPTLWTWSSPSMDKITPEPFSLKTPMLSSPSLSSLSTSNGEESDDREARSLEQEENALNDPWPNPFIAPEDNTLFNKFPTLSSPIDLETSALHPNEKKGTVNAFQNLRENGSKTEEVLSNVSAHSKKKQKVRKNSSKKRKLEPFYHRSITVASPFSNRDVEGKKEKLIDQSNALTTRHTGEKTTPSIELTPAHLKQQLANLGETSFIKKCYTPVSNAKNAANEPLNTRQVEKLFLKKLELTSKEDRAAAYLFNQIRQGQLSPAQAFNAYAAAQWLSSKENSASLLEKGYFSALKQTVNPTLSHRLMQSLETVMKWTANSSKTFDFLATALGGGVGALTAASLSLGNPLAIATGAIAGGGVGKTLSYLSKNIVCQIQNALQARIALSTTQGPASYDKLQWIKEITQMSKTLSPTSVFSAEPSAQVWAKEHLQNAQLLNYLEKEIPNYCRSLSAISLPKRG